MNAKPLSEAVSQLEDWLVSRGQGANTVSRYHYIFQVFLGWFRSFHEEYYSEELMERCLREHYGITEGTTLSRRQSYKKAVLRASQLLRDAASGKNPEDRYLPPKSPLSTKAYNDILAEFRDHLEKCGRAQGTVATYLRSVIFFLEFAEKRNLLSFSDFSVQSIRDYEETLAGFKNATAKSFLGALRSFLRFLHTNGRIEQDLSRFIDKVPVREQTSLPSVWTKEEVLKLLAAIDRGNPGGKRDYAMILLAARLGLRVGDINSLKFENIDWEKGLIVFTQNKMRHETRLPLLRDVGWAIIDYVKNGRPDIDSPYIFLTHITPFKNFALSNHQHAMIKKYLLMTDIQNQPKKVKRGMHSLRHTLANRLQENRETLHTVSSVMGHSSLDSASYYIKADIELLRECALSLSEAGL